MKRLVVIFVLSPVFFFAQAREEIGKIERMKYLISILADDTLKGRSTGSPEELVALNFIAKSFRENTNLKLHKQEFRFLKDSNEITSFNGYSFLNFHKKETILIGAHYDHIGMGGSLSKSKVNNQVHNGADDNASGVAMVLALSENIAQFKNPNYNYLIVFYSAHEVGLFGSTNFFSMLQKKTRKFKKIALVLNFDMIGRLDPELLKLKCMVSPSARSFLTHFNPEYFDLKLNLSDDDKLYNLDTREFAKNNIPCINLTTGMHNDYHTVSDDIEYLNLNGMIKIEEFIIHFLHSLN